MLEYWEEMPQYFITSSSKSIGKEDLLSFIEQTNTEIEALKKKP
jgi:GTP-binding protein